MKQKGNATVNTRDPQSRIFTIPNVLSCFRLCLIPLFVWLYCVREAYVWTSGILILSGITDLVDGYIARRFHMTSNLGKVLDPVADKLTQAAMMLCLVSRFPLIWLLFILMVLKEALAAITGYCVIKRTGKVYGAQWHGKAATFLLDAAMILHVFWYEIPTTVSNALIGLCLAIMLLSATLYSARNYRAIKNG